MDSREGSFLLGFVLLGIAPLFGVMGAEIAAGIVALALLISSSVAFMA